MNRRHTESRPRDGSALRSGRSHAFSLVELMCVMAIIAVLAALFLGAAGRAYQRVKAFAGEFDNLVHVDELRLKLSKQVTEHPDFPTLSLDDLLQRCPVSSKCDRFLRSKVVTYYPFAGTSPGTQVALLVDRGKEGVAVFTKEVLCSPPFYAN